MTTSKYQASIFKDIVAVQKQIAEIKDRKSVAAILVANNLMKTNKSLHFAIWLSSKIYRQTIEQRWRVFFSYLPIHAENLVISFLYHMTNGLDFTDASSFGGLSQKELDLAVKLFNVQ